MNWTEEAEISEWIVFHKSKLKMSSTHWLKLFICNDSWVNSSLEVWPCLQQTLKLRKPILIIKNKLLLLVFLTWGLPYLFMLEYSIWLDYFNGAFFFYYSIELIRCVHNEISTSNMFWLAVHIGKSYSSFIFSLDRQIT